MVPFVISYPVFDPVAFNVGPFPVRWYALAYAGGLGLGWAYAWMLLRSNRFWGAAPRPNPASLSDLVIYLAIAVVVGGRLGQVIFYDPHYYLGHPLEIVEPWKGGMSFHGGLIGAALAIWYFASEKKVALLTVTDLCAAATPIGILLGRIANFIRPELWGRPTDVPWAMIFPGVDGGPRHPSHSMRRAWRVCCCSWCSRYSCAAARSSAPVSSPEFSASATARRGLFPSFSVSPTRNWKSFPTA